MTKQAPEQARSTRRKPTSPSTTTVASQMNRAVTDRPFNATALRTFSALDAIGQYCVLNTIAALSKWRGNGRVPTSRLLATPAQRQAARTLAAERKALDTKRAADQVERVEIRRKLNAIHNRAQQRRGGLMTAAEARRRDALYVKLNAIDKIGGAL